MSKIKLEETIKITRKLMDMICEIDNNSLDYVDEDGYHMYDETGDLWEMLAAFDEALTKHLKEG